ncbi:Dipeptide transport system permease protein DppC [Aliiroseovarius pelagivivens]|uniref:Dipeptide transport system permease protein DppC n=1 Tax=Aliiroseovarius pelagivivens TaxID=1639690 RepID=A0A2R8AIQ1_9RHOB|nr:ABC transporter permease [Aliiroseovarius pelagivivens]SPF75921.1 Dipeptide transport system permease protein DppC [Aliiroseovarius pelagivivens]
MTDLSYISASTSGFWRRFQRHKGAVIGGGLLGLLLLAVLIGPFLWPHSAGQINVTARNLGPSLSHPMGTDHLGRDLFAAILQGGRVTLLVGVVAMGLSVLIGAAVGILSGMVRWLDAPLMRLTDLFLALPVLPLLLVTIMLWRDSLRTLFGAEAGIFLLIVAMIGLTSWMQTARILRAEVLALKKREFVTAATALGLRPWGLIRRHILPNVMGVIIVSATLGLANAIITESALSFLGLGFPPDHPTWGRLLFDGTEYLTLTPARAIWPGLMITLTVLCANYLGDGLRDALDPRGGSGRK